MSSDISIEVIHPVGGINLLEGCGRFRSSLTAWEQVYKVIVQQNKLESLTIVGDSPVCNIL
jgi:hypothetical protein